MIIRGSDSNASQQRTRPLFASQAMPPVGRTMRLSQDDVALLDKQQQEWEQSHPTIPDSPVKRTHGRAQSRGALFATL